MIERLLRDARTKPVLLIQDKFRPSFQVGPEFIRRFKELAEWLGIPSSHQTCLEAGSFGEAFLESLSEFERDGFHLTYFGGRLCLANRAQETAVWLALSARDEAEAVEG
jgi:hypothetical protein